MGVEVAVRAVPRRYEALAFVIARICASGTSPSFDEIAIELGISKSRARRLIDELVAEDLVERRPGQVRSFRVRDVAASRSIVVQVLNRLGWIDAQPLAGLLQPYTDEHLPMVPPFEHLPDVE